MRIIITAVLLLQFLSFNAQNTYIKNLKNSTPFYPYDGITTSDNNNIIVGGIADVSNKVSPAIIKLDNNGDTIWTQTFPNVGTRSTQFHNIIELSNNNLIVGGFYHDGGTNSEPIVVELTSTGTILSTKIIPINFTNQHFGLSETKLATDGVNTFLLYASGKQVGFSFPSIVQYGFMNVLKLDQNLDTVWTSKLELTPEIGSDRTVSALTQDIKINNTGEIIFLHRAMVSSGGIISTEVPYFITKLSANGNLVNSYKIAATSNRDKVHFSSITIANNNNVFLTGSATVNNSSLQDNAFMLELDPNLNFIDKGIYFNTRGDIKSLIYLNNGNWGMGIASSSLSTNGSSRTAVAELDNNFNMQWARVYGATSTGLLTMDQDANNNIFSIGSTRFYSSFNYFSGVAIKSDSIGMIPSCIEDVSDLSLVADSIDIDHTITATYLVTPDTLTENIILTNTSFDLVSEDLSITYNDTIIEPLCNGLQGSVDLSMTSSNSPHTFTWSNGTAAEDLNDFTGLYGVTIIDDYGCVHIDSFNLTQPDVLNATYSSTNVNCFGFANGSIDLTAFGGTPGYSYSWTNLATTEDLSNLSGGFYQVTITDTNNCQKTVGVSVGEPQQLVSVITNTTHASCNDVCDGELVVFASGGYAPYTYLWNDPMTQTTDTAVGLCDGQYFATITDSNGCQTFVNGLVTEPIALTSSMWESPTECGLSNGASGVTPSGGTLPYSILWWGTAITNDTITGLDFGQAGVNVVDENGCLLRDSIDVSTTTLGNEECLVSVSASNQNKIVWEKPIASNISGYNIYRNIAGSYAQIAFHPYDSLSEYTDVTFGVDPNITSYRYKVSVVDTCGFESGLSFYHETIHLTANLGVGGEVNLIWDDYEGASFNSYNIMLDSTGTGNYNLVASVSAGSFTYTHLTPPQDSAEYIIEVVLDSTCTSTQKANHNSTRSNKGKVQSSSVAANINNIILENSNIYPNPTKDVVNIELRGAKEWSYQVFNVVGELIYEQNSIVAENDNINVKDWSDGIYIAKIQLGKQTINKKIVKQ